MITKNTIADGDANLSALIAKDLLQLRSRKQSIASALFHDDNTLAADYVREQLARLLNGNRRPLLSPNASEQLLAVLQKLSIRPSAQRELLINGIFEWLCTQLGQQKFGQAGLEFGVALLHNLVVNPISHSIAVRHKKRLLETLRILLGSARGGQALQYTCSTLYILLCLPQVRKTARDSTDLEKILIERAQKEKNLEQIRQLIVVYLLLRGELDLPEKRKQLTTTVTDLEDAFPDYLEAEIDSTDPLVPGHSELFGKRLLIKNFLSKPLPPSLAKYYLPLSQFIIEEEGQRENVPGVVPVRRQQPTVQTTNLSGSSPRKKSQQKRVSNNKEASSFLLKPEREGGYVSGVLPLIRQVHFERTNTMSSHATFVVENNSRRPLIANDGLENVIASLKGNTLIEEHCQRIVQQNFQQLKIANGNEDVGILQNFCEMLIIEEIPMEESIGGIGGDEQKSEEIDYYEEKEYTAAFAARPKIRRTPPKLPDEGLLDEE
uniref:LisH domain-containing protein n=1 Tax=Meloidogyne javanica TaxID=6303 RepID=A0A915M7H0_MELJA